MNELPRREPYTWYYSCALRESPLLAVILLVIRDWKHDAALPSPGMDLNTTYMLTFVTEDANGQLGSGSEQGWDAVGRDTGKDVAYAAPNSCGACISISSLSFPLKFIVQIAICFCYFHLDFLELIVSEYVSNFVDGGAILRQGSRVYIQDGAEELCRKH